MDDKQLLRLARWIDGSVISKPEYQTYLRVVKEKLEKMTSAIITSEEEKTYLRGKIAGRYEQLNHMMELVKEFQSKGTVEDSDR